MSDRRPAEVFPPGEFLKDELDERGWTQTEFAEIIGRPIRAVNELVLGKRAITPETANEIAAALGTSAHFWMNLDAAYQLSKIRPASERISREAALRERFPVREMKKRGWILGQQILRGNRGQSVGVLWAEVSRRTLPVCARRSAQLCSRLVIDADGVANPRSANGNGASDRTLL